MKDNMFLLYTGVIFGDSVHLKCFLFPFVLALWYRHFVSGYDYQALLRPIFAKVIALLIMLSNLFSTFPTTF